MSAISPEKFDRLQRIAIEFHGILLTESSVPGLVPVSHNMTELLSAKLRSTACQLQLADLIGSPCHQSAPLSFLREETAAQLQSKLSSALLSLLKDLRLGDVKTEVLASWLTEIETSGSSSVVADGESGDSVAADPRNDATPDTSAKGVRDDA